MLFYQKFFFVVWWWLAVMILTSLIGIVFRILQLVSRRFGQFWMKRNIHLTNTKIVKNFSAADTFVLLLLFENLDLNLKQQVLKLLEKTKKVSRSKLKLQNQS